MTKRAVLVVGPESSGTRLVTDILVRAGYVGSANHVQSLDWTPPDDATPLVWRRSLPHRMAWPDLGEMTRYLRTLGYAVSAVTTDRNDGPMEVAQARDHVKNRLVARRNITHARSLCELLSNPQAGGMPVERVRYEELVAQPVETICRIVPALSTELAQEIADEIKIYDGNKPYGSGATS